MKFAFSFLTFLFATVLLQAQNNQATQKIDKKLSELLEVSHAPGFSICIVRGDKVIYSKGFGYANIEKKQKVDENTLFPIGSTSKAFTTALLGILEGENALSFDDSPIKYLPGLKFYNAQLNTELTIKDLVSHRSGLPRHDLSWYLFPTEDKDSLLARVQYHQPFTSFRTQWYYNNFGYLIQGMIAAKITGKSWEQNIRDRFFEPLGMLRSNLSIAEMKTFDNIATGYQWKNLDKTEAMEYFNIAAISPAGSINSSAAEMSAWLKLWLNKGRYNGKQILPESYIVKAQNPLMLVGGGIADPQFPDQHLKSYGYAWFESSYKGHYRMEHGGNIDGFSGNVCLFPADSLGIVILCNQDGSFVPALARNIVSDILLKTKEDNWVNYHKDKVADLKKQLESSKSGQIAERVANTSSSHSMREFEGTYTHPGYGDFTVSISNDSLFAQFPVRKYYLQHWHYDVFRGLEVKNANVDTTSELGTNLNFRTGESGQISSVSIKVEPTLEPMEFTRTPPRIKFDAKNLKLFSGNYELAGAILKVTEAADALLLDVPGQPQYTLVPSGENEFTVQGLSGYKARFAESMTHVELQLIQPNGTFVAKKTIKNK